MDPVLRRLLIALATAVAAVLGYYLYRWITRHDPPVAPAPPAPAQKEKLVLSEDVRRGQLGSVSYRGSVWALRNESDRDLKMGETVYVERVETDHTLVVRAAGGFVERL